LRHLIFSCVCEWGGITFFLDSVENLVNAEVFQEFVSRLSTLFDNHVDVHKRQPSISFELLARKLAEFKDLILWLKAKVKA
jgi:hypothetical protein